MTNPAAALGGARAASITLAGVAGFALALAASAQVAIPIPGTAVPITLQPLVVVLAGLWLGPAAGAASMALYLLAGTAGLPVFAPGGAPGALRLVGPTGGYLLAYPAAAFVAGRLGATARSFAARALAAGAGMLVVYLGGLAQLAILVGSVPAAVVQGVLPFAALDAVKALLAAALAPRRASPSP
jgi:biotin transport system substrate-specific component